MIDSNSRCPFKLLDLTNTLELCDIPAPNGTSSTQFLLMKSAEQKLLAQGPKTKHPYSMTCGIHPSEPRSLSTHIQLECRMLNSPFRKTVQCAASKAFVDLSKVRPVLRPVSLQGCSGAQYVQTPNVLHRISVSRDVVGIVLDMHDNQTYFFDNTIKISVSW